jgi:hypothetical protein
MEGVIVGTAPRYACTKQDATNPNNSIEGKYKSGNVEEFDEEFL